MHEAAQQSLIDAKSLVGYWSDKLSSLEDGARSLPACYGNPSARTKRRPISALRLPASKSATEGQVLAAFCVALSRHGAGEHIPIHIPGGFALCNLSEETIVKDYVAKIERELETSRKFAKLTSLDCDGLLSIKKEIARRCHFALTTYRASSPISALRLNVDSTSKGGALEICLMYDASIYPHYLARQLGKHTARLLDLITEYPDRSLSELDAVTEVERALVLKTFNADPKPFEGKLTLQTLFERAVSKWPDSTAVVYEGRSVTYAQLCEESSRIAEHLRREFDVQPGERVGLAVTRSEKMIAGILGILKCGAAYVPIDTRHTWETIRYMVGNSDVSRIVVDADSVSGISAFRGKLFFLDVDLPGPAPEVCRTPINPTDDAYVIYTSGSTGRPKGVVVQHQAICNTIIWRLGYYKLSREDVTLQMPSLAFDSSVIDIFCTLSAGGMLVVPREELKLDSKYLLDLIQRHSVTNFIATPSFYKRLCQDLRGQAPSLRAITLAGESVTWSLVAQHERSLPHTQLYNEYGPTENAVCSTACVLSTNEERVTIGSPVSNVNVHLIDAQGRLCGVGMPGEIYLSGNGLSRGYCNRPDLTASAFTEHPVENLRRSTAYRSGDRGLWLPNGKILFLGRSDNQVKIRGVRVEASDVELVVQGHPSILDAAVVCKQDETHSNYLAAYVVANSSLDRAALLSYLKKLLPAYSLPDSIEFIEELPLNYNGKVDRAKLSQCAGDRKSRKTPQKQARSSDIEQKVWRIFEDLLRREIEPTEDFFELGMHSLRIMQAFTRIRAELDPTVSLADIYACRTVRALAARISKEN